MYKKLLKLRSWVSTSTIQILLLSGSQERNLFASNLMIGSLNLVNSKVTPLSEVPTAWMTSEEDETLD